MDGRKMSKPVVTVVWSLASAVINVTVVSCIMINVPDTVAVLVRGRVPSAVVT
jgi:hypothetical protein